jgi:hypothetical protein
LPSLTHLWLLVPLAGLIELGAHWFQASRPPDLEDWRGVRAAVRDLRGAAGLVVVAPRWAEPAARAAFGDALMPFEHVARADESTFGTAVEVGILGHEATELAGWREVRGSTHGRFRLRVLENPKPVSVRFDFVAAVAAADVYDLEGIQKESCSWTEEAAHTAGGLHGHPAYPSARHQCPGGDWHFVGVTAVEDENWRGRRCLWAHPRGKKTLVIAYSDVPLGGAIRGYGTLPWWLEREKRGGPVRLEVSVDGEIIGIYKHRDGDPWEPFEFRTGRKAGESGHVEFRISAERPKDRQFCFTADVR